MWPVLVTLANIDAKVWMKASSNAYALVGYIPVPKFNGVSAEVHSILTARVYHSCLDLIFRGCKQTYHPGYVTSDLWGGRCCVHPVLAALSADYPEQLLAEGVASGQSPISTATTKDFGDGYRHPNRKAKSILDNIKAACAEADPWNLTAFAKVCKKRRLNGVIKPFWNNWGNAEPSEFLTPDPLHQWHKFYFDHIVQWAINTVGADELDFCLQVLQPLVGVRKWPDGISKLKQLTGRDHRALERILVSVIAGAVNNDVLHAIRAITNFIFQGQNLYHYTDTLHALEEALCEFHHYKQAILDAGGRRGKKGPMTHFNIPKLEGLHHVVCSIKSRGAAYQYTTDITERLHKTVAKVPFWMSNKINYHPQCCRFLDRQEKIQFFDLYLVLSQSESHISTAMEMEAATAASMEKDSPEELELDLTTPATVDYRSLWSQLPDEAREVFNNRATIPRQLFSRRHAFTNSTNQIAFLVSQKPHFVLTVDDAAYHFHLPDL
jgi:hypothetical protein